MNVNDSSNEKDVSLHAERFSPLVSLGGPQVGATGLQIRSIEVPNSATESESENVNSRFPPPNRPAPVPPNASVVGNFQVKIPIPQQKMFGPLVISGSADTTIIAWDIEVIKNFFFFFF